MHRPARRAVVIATAAALGLTGLVAPAATAAEPTDLFISEYIEGSSNNKAIEIYNPTGAAVDLTGYTIAQYSNGSTTATTIFTLSGSLAAGDVWVGAHSSAVADILAQADATTGAGLFNGDDAVALRKDGVPIDVIGQIGFRPTSEWGADLTSTADNTLRRNADVCAGDPDGSDEFDPSVEWTGYATNTFDGLGAHTADCGGDPTLVINEFSASTTGTDVEYVELLASGDVDLSQYAVLEIEGDSNSNMGTVDEVITFSDADAVGDGLVLVNLPANALENGTMSLLLVTGEIPAFGTDLDAATDTASGDGVIDDGFGFTIVDSIAVNDSGAGDLTYGGVTLDVEYDGLAFAPGGASRIPDGLDTDTTADWVRNDFDLAGIPGFTGSLVAGEAYNTPGAANEVYVAPPVEPELLPIGTVQGTTDTSPYVGETVTVEGTVTGDFQVGGFNGFYVQDAGDGDPATSDGIFVYGGGVEVVPGDVVSVTGEISEYFGLTEISPTAVDIAPTGAALPTPASLTLPLTDEVREAHEGMLVTLPQTLSILEFYNFGRYGQIVAGLDRQMTPTAVFDPGSTEATELAAQNLAERITIDDGRSSQNPDPAIHPNGEDFTLDNSFRGGDHLTNVTGVLDYRFSTWAVQPTQGADYESVNPRTGVPDVGGSLTVSSFNVLNYFTTIDPTPSSSSDDDYTRGADTAEELQRQQDKIVSALAAIDADVFGLIEIENSGVEGFDDSTAAPNEAVATLTAALNAEVGDDTYAYIATGPLGTDAITTALVYKKATVEPVGDFALLTESVDDRWLDDKNRPALAQTFADVETGDTVTVVVNHLKSKGSSCTDVGDPDLGDGAGNCNVTRTNAAKAMVDWLAGDPTGQGAGRELIIGDLNSYDKEDPIDALVAGGFTDLEAKFQGEDAYSYVFDGQLGYLDYALAGTDLEPAITGAAAWHINSDEPSLIDYDMSFKLPAQDALYAPDPYRSSDHDPVIIGIDTVPPTIEVTASPGVISPPNAQMVEVTITVDAADDSGSVDVAFTDATASGAKKAKITQIDDTTFLVKAINKAVYEFTYTATDAAGHAVSSTATVTVVPPAPPMS